MSRKFYLPLMILFALPGGCGDTFHDPVLLHDQKALSDVYKDRPLYSSLYYEGTTMVEGNRVHVFLLKIISKFTSARVFRLYYLPVNKINITTTAGSYQGNDHARLTYRFGYRHDDGEFTLSDRKRLLERIKADFAEKYSYLEDRCIKAKKQATSNPGSYPLVKYAAEICFQSANYEDSRAFTLLLKKNIDAFDRYTSKGQMLHDYHTLMGRHAVRDGEIEAAKNHLELSIEVTPSAVMSSFGPNMELANALLEQGEDEAVIRYLDGCARFWNDEKIQLWKTKIREGNRPGLNVYARENDGQQKNKTPACYLDYKNKQYRQALDSCKAEAAVGKAYAQFNLGHLYRTGQAGVKDVKKAVEFYQLAAAQDYAEAQFSLGIMYFQGAGTAVDMEKARYWWEKSEGNGIASARVQQALKRIPEGK